MARDFTLDEFRRQLDQIGRLGDPGLLASLPGLSEVAEQAEPPAATVDRVRRVIDAVPDQERAYSEVIDAAARSRIAASAGTTPEQVGRFLSQFQRLRGVMLELAGMSLWQRIKLVLGFGRRGGSKGGGERERPPPRR